MQNKKTYYEILGIDRNTPKNEIKKAYFKLAKIYHPDVNNSPEAERIFKELNEAYETLIDDVLRHDYDESLNDPTRDIREQISNKKEYDPTWINEWIFGDKTIDELKKNLSNLDQMHIIFTYEYFWNLILSADFNVLKIYFKRKVYYLFITFKNAIDKGILSFIITNNINNNDLRNFDVAINNVAYRLKNDYQNTQEGLFQVLDFLNSNNFLKSSSSGILALWSSETTANLIYIIENILASNQKYICDLFFKKEKEKPQNNGKRKRKRRKNKKKKKKKKKIIRWDRIILWILVPLVLIAFTIVLIWYFWFND